MEKHPLFPYSFFNRLRKEVGIELDMQQYFGFLRIFTSDIKLNDPKDLLELCKIHWLTRPRFERQFEKLFWEEVKKITQVQPVRVEREKQAEKIGNRKDEEKEEILAPPPAPTPLTSLPEQAPPPKVGEEEVLNSIYVNFKESPGVGSRDHQESSFSFLDNDFIFSNKYLPASARRMKQNWRYLKSRAEKKPGLDLDLPAIVKSIAQNGFFYSPVFLLEKIYRHHILFLIDHGGSMAAFESLSAHLVSTIRESLQAQYTTSLYFHNYPVDRLFLDPYHTRAIRLSEFLRDIPRHSGLVFIISDAGAARGRIHSGRIEQTREFLKTVRRRIPHLLWLNPMPEERWAGSSAAYLSFFVDMLEASEAGFRRLPEKLKHL
ncbi:MAG: hypothetical protein H6563_07120 [Lewinellaceae bacterium]|nr:hypothetical protein [Lewinellaceae bacterium]